MLNISEVFETTNMIEHDNLDVRTVTMGISLFDCISTDVDKTCRLIEAKLLKYAGNLARTCDQMSAEFGIPIVNKRISVTPISVVGASCCKSPEDYVKICMTLDRVREKLGLSFLGGFSAIVSKGMTASDRMLIEAIPEALAKTDLVCASVNVGSTKTGINTVSYTHLTLPTILLV